MGCMLAVASVKFAFSTWKVDCCAWATCAATGLDFVVLVLECN